MFIELTDHLRCPEDHEESFLVLLPDRIEDRSVKTGQLGCPVCGRTFNLEQGVVDFGGTPDLETGRSRLDGDGLAALAGLHGPGGYFTLVGPLASLWQEFREANPGVALVALNPPDEIGEVSGLSVIRSRRIPLKSRSMRGVALGSPYAERPFWVEEAARVVLPGLRIVGEGKVPAEQNIELMATADGIWVGTPVRQSART